MTPEPIPLDDARALVDAAGVDGVPAASVAVLSPSAVRIHGAGLDVVCLVEGVTTPSIAGPRVRPATVYRVYDGDAPVGDLPTLRAAIGHALGLVLERRVAGVVDVPTEALIGRVGRMLASARVHGRGVDQLRASIDADSSAHVFVDGLSVLFDPSAETDGDAYVVDAEVCVPGSQWEPSYTDLAEVGSYATLRDAVAALLGALVSDRVDNAALASDAYVYDDVGGAT